MVAWLLAGCHGGRLRPLEPLPDADAQALLDRCGQLFPLPPWEAVHVIEASLPLSHETALLGAVRAEPAGGGFRSVLMSQEGMVLFDASYEGGRIDVHRAVPPFDREGFGEGTMDDIRLVLLAPAVGLPVAGLDAQGTPTCRWRDGEETLEAWFSKEGVALRRLDERHRELRSARWGVVDDCGFAETIDLSAPGKLGYDLRMVLVQRASATCDGAGEDEAMAGQEARE